MKENPLNNYVQVQKLFQFDTFYTYWSIIGNHKLVIFHHLHFFVRTHQIFLCNSASVQIKTKLMGFNKYFYYRISNMCCKGSQANLMVNLINSSPGVEDLNTSGRFYFVLIVVFHLTIRFEFQIEKLRNESSFWNRNTLLSELNIVKYNF